MRIDRISNHVERINMIAHWQHDEFGYLNPSITIEDRTDRLNRCAKSESLPLTLVASFDGGEIGGCASILESTIIRSDLSPWLSSVYVPPAHRGKGIASALSLRAVGEAARLGYQRLYLFTPKSKHLYARLGWVEFGHIEHRGTSLVLMERNVDLK